MPPGAQLKFSPFQSGSHAGKFSEPKSSEPPGEALKTSKYQLSVSGKKIGYGHRVCGLDLGGAQEIPNLATTAECSW